MSMARSSEKRGGLRSAGRWTRGPGRGGRTRTCTSFRTEDFKSSAAAITPRPRSEALDLLVDLPDASLTLLFLGERFGLLLLLGLLLLQETPVRAGDPLVDVLDPRRQMALVRLEHQRLVHHAETARMTEDRRLRRLGEELRPLSRRRAAELDTPRELVALEIGRFRWPHPLDLLGHVGLRESP